MISRIWHGYTILEKVDTYEKLLHEEIFVGIKTVISKDIRAYNCSGE
jgi:hypothetical protein